jgi:hypothetical protein
MYVWDTYRDWIQEKSSAEKCARARSFCDCASPGDEGSIVCALVPPKKSAWERGKGGGEVTKRGERPANMAAPKIFAMKTMAAPTRSLVMVRALCNSLMQRRESREGGHMVDRPLVLQRSPRHHTPLAIKGTPPQTTMDGRGGACSS